MQPKLNMSAEHVCFWLFSPWLAISGAKNPGVPHLT